MDMSAQTYNKIESAHQMYRSGMHQDALKLYTEALAVAKTKAQKIALHSNRAACYLKLHNFQKAADECSSVLSLDHFHPGALMLRAQTLVTLKEYQSALFDVNRLIEQNPSSEVYQNLQARLKTQLSLAPIPESEEEEAIAAELEETTFLKQSKLLLQRQPHQDEQGKQQQNHESHKQERRQLQHIRQTEQWQQQENSKQEKSGVFGINQDKKLCAKAPVGQVMGLEEPSDSNSRGWETIPKPRGHSRLDYSRWDEVDDDSSEEEEDEDLLPQYRFRVRKVGLQSVK